VSIDKTTVALGQPVVVTYSTEGFGDTQITVTNWTNTIDLGSGDQSGTIKILPVSDGEFTVAITGYGDARLGSDSTCALTKSATCIVT
jgi:hypothetical protein